MKLVYAAELDAEELRLILKGLRENNGADALPMGMLAGRLEEQYQHALADLLKLK